MTRTERPDQTGFTLLELVVVLAILAITTGLAVRALDRVEDQRRFEDAQRGLRELSEAVLGSPDDRNIDGTRTISGFVADMGRLPKTVAESGGLGLRELWIAPNLDYRYDLRPALEAYGVAPGEEDGEVLVPSGWRGPYLRLPIGPDTLLDAWGNPMVSPANPSTTEYVRFFEAPDTPVTDVGQEIRIIRHLGADGREGESGDQYDRDEEIKFTDESYRAALTGQVEVLDGNSAAVPSAVDKITIRVFGPDPLDSRKIRVVSSGQVSFTSNPVAVNIPLSEGLTIGPRIVRAYFDDVDGSGTTDYRKSAVKQVTLRPGNNFLQLTIDR